MLIEILIHPLLALLGLLATLPACAQQEGGATVPKWQVRMSYMEHGHGQYISYAKRAATTDGPFTWQAGAVNHFVQGQNTPPPKGKPKPVPPQKGRSQESAAHKADREAVEAATISLAKFHNKISELRSALNESVPIQIEECQRINTEEPGYRKQDWERLEKDASTNHDAQAYLLIGQVATGLNANIGGLLGYMRGFSDDEREALRMAVSSLRKARDGYIAGLTDNAEAAEAVSKHDCAQALELRTKSGGHFYDGDSYWEAAFKILERLAPPSTGKK